LLNSYCCDFSKQLSKLTKSDGADYLTYENCQFSRRYLEIIFCLLILYQACNCCLYSCCCHCRLFRILCVAVRIVLRLTAKIHPCAYQKQLWKHVSYQFMWYSSCFADLRFPVQWIFGDSQLETNKIDLWVVLLKNPRAHTLELCLTSYMILLLKDLCRQK